jgi:hypothetical protein
LPTVVIGSTNGLAEVRYTGVLQSTCNLRSNMQDRIPQPPNPWQFLLDEPETSQFFRTIRR